MGHMGLYGLSPWIMNHLLIGMHIQVRPYPYRDMMSISSLSTFGGHGRTLLHFATIDVASLPVMSRFVGQKWGGQMINGGFLKWGYPQSSISRWDFPS